MNKTIILLIGMLGAVAARGERVDNVLARMVPGNTTGLVGMRMQQLKSTPLFQKLVAQRKLPQLDEFARQTGFDPRRDVRDLIFALNGQSTVLLARGSFHLANIDQAKKFNYHGYVVYSKEGANGTGGGFCLLDSTLAAAGPLPALEAALNQYKSGNRNNAASLLDRARGIPEDFQIWGVTSGDWAYTSQNMPGNPTGPDLGRIFRSLKDTIFEADLRNGLNATAEGYCTSPQDAKSLSDAARGMVGMARLKTPEGQPELLRIWDGIKVDQTDRKITLTIHVAQDLIDQLLHLIGAV